MNLRRQYRRHQRSTIDVRVGSVTVYSIPVAIPMSDVTQILSQIEQGDSQAAEKLLPLVYDELRKLAAVRLAQEKPGQTLQATALVHEAYLRLVGGENVQSFDGRGHFYFAAAEAMRRILVESARRKKRLRHGGDYLQVELDEELPSNGRPLDELLAVNEALDQLTAANDQAAKLVKLHYFAGLSLDEAANALEVSQRTAYRQWAFARAWLFRELGDDGSSSS
jgi:RNA polymerase sigma factor (TIGR02999 family)